MACNPEALFATAEAILSSAWRALSALPNTRDIDTYVSLGEPPADCCNLLTVYVPDYGPTAKANAREANSAAATGLPPKTETRFVVALWEACYPSVTDEGGRFQLPKPGTLHETNRVLYTHGFTIFNGVQQDYRSRSLFIDPRQCPRLTFGKLRPLGPNGGCAGWTFDVTGDLDG